MSPSWHCPDAGVRRFGGCHAESLGSDREMQAVSHARRRDMLRDLELMSRRQLLRRGGTLVAGASAASILFKAGIPLHASAQEATPLNHFRSTTASPIT